MSKFYVSQTWLGIFRDIGLFLFRGDYSPATPFKMYKVGFRAFKSPPTVIAFGWFPCVQVTFVLT